MDKNLKDFSEAHGHTEGGDRSGGDERMNEHNWHCIARLLQGAIYGGRGNVLDGCAFCKFKCHEDGNGDPAPHYDKIMAMISEKTGVDLLPGSSKLHQSNFPYKKFLKKSNDEAKEYFRNFFRDV